MATANHQASPHVRTVTMVYTITVHLRANSEPSSVEKLKAKLIEASRIYSKDKETISWFVMQSTSDPRDFTIVCLSSNDLT